MSEFERSLSRRQGLALLGLAGWQSLARGQEEEIPHIATNTYPWSTFARRRNEKLDLHTEELLSRIAKTGVAGYEPIINSASEFEGLGARLQAAGLEMRSLYVNSTLHDESKVEESIESVLAIAEGARELGTRIIVTNPSPIRWGGPENKTDEQLRFQARSLDRLGGALREMGIALAYHNHDIELRHGAREFHHMLTATDPENVKFCLDAHWIFRGCGNSEVAVFDVLAHYRDRIVELHLRQSAGGAWTEAFSLEGDIDYGRLINDLRAEGIRPHLVLEQAVEKETPYTMDVVEAHRKGRRALLEINS